MRLQGLVIIVLLTGCAAGPSLQSQHADATLAADVTTCETLNPGAKERPVVPLFRCKMEADAKWQRARPGNPNIYFADAIHAQVIAAAQEYDDGKINKTELIARVAKLQSDLADRLNIESAQEAAIQRQNQAAASAALLSAAAAMNTPPPPPAPMPMPTTTKCNFYPGTATCQTH